MKKLITTALFLLAGVHLVVAQKKATKEKEEPVREKITIGAKFPQQEFNLTSFDGTKVPAQSLKPKSGLLLIFSCNTCPYVIKAQERTRMVIEKAKERGIVVVIINSNEAQRDNEDAPQAMKLYAQEQGYDVPYLIDGGSALADALGATRTPEVFLFDKGNHLVYMGAMEDNPSNPSESKTIYIKNAINAMLKGEKPDPSVTRSVGCTIKRVK